MTQKSEKQKPIKNHWELEVYQLAFDAAMRIYPPGVIPVSTQWRLKKGHPNDI